VSIGPAKIRYQAESHDIHPNVQDEEPHFLRATFRQHLQIVALILHVMQGVMTVHLPKPQFVNPKVWLQSNHQILVLKLFLQFH
jgi:hypothetical protein